MTEIANQAHNEPWPPLETAAWIFDRASFVLVGSLLVGMLATVAIVWMGIVKEHHWNVLREQSNEKVAGLEAETAKAKAELGKANADIAKANAEIAEARKQTAKANLALERERGARQAIIRETEPRNLTREQRSNLELAIKGKISELNVYSVPDREAKRYGVLLAVALQEAGVKSEWRQLYSYTADVPMEDVSLYDLDEKRGDEIARVIAQSTGSVGRHRPSTPPSDISSPALIVGWQRVPLVRAPFPQPFPAEEPVVPWDPQ